VVSFPQVSTPKPCIRLFFPPYVLRATCPAHHILLYFITRKLFGEQYRSLSPSLRSFLHSPVTSSLLVPNILLSTLFSNTLSYVPPSMWATKFHTHTEQPKNNKHQTLVSMPSTLRMDGQTDRLTGISPLPNSCSSPERISKASIPNAFMPDTY